MANAFANGLKIAAQKRPRPIGRATGLPYTTQPVMPQPTTGQQPTTGLDPRPPTESGFPTQAPNDRNIWTEAQNARNAAQSSNAFIQAQNARTNFQTPAPSTPPITTQPVRKPSLIQDVLRRSRELQI